MSRSSEKIKVINTVNEQQSDCSKDDSDPVCETSEKDAGASSRWERIREFIERIWAWEIFCVVVSLGGMGATVGVLAYMNNKPLTSWTASISPNVVVSILSTLTKATVLAVVGTCIAQLRWSHFKTAPQRVGDMDMFANATKGTLGSLKMFWIVPKKHTSGQIACFGAFLVVIAIAIDPFSQQMLKYEVEDTSIYGLAASIPATTGIGNSTTIIDNSQAWKGLYAGLLGFDYPMPYQCVSGNCTWTPFATLGVCGSCQTSQPASNIDQNSTTIQASMGNLSMTLKNGAAPVSAHPDVSEVYTLVKSVVSASYPYGFSSPTVFEFLIAQLLVDATSKPQNFTPAWNLTRCTVDWCGRVYQNVQVIKGNLTQPTPTTVELLPNVTSECYNSTVCQDFIAADPVVNTTYRIDVRSDTRNIRELLNFDQDVNAFNNNTWDVSDALSVTATLFWNINITAAFAKACNTFTDFIRSDQSNQITGTTLTETTYIRVRWGWLALPATIVVGTLVRLVLVISVNRGTMLWKDSSLPLLLHPLDYPGQSQTSSTDAQPSAMNKQANGMQVRLVHRDDGGAAFLVTSSDPAPKRAQTSGPP